MSALRFYIIIPAGAEERDNQFHGISDAKWPASLRIAAATRA
jgi:hypothetical protein